MPVIANIHGIKIKIHHNEHQPPHVHVYFGGEMVAIGIKTLKITGKMQHRILQKATHWIKENQDLLTKAWEIINE